MPGDGAFAFGGGACRQVLGPLSSGDGLDSGPRDQAVRAGSASATAWLACLALMWLALLPMTILGVAIGLWVGADAPLERIF
jgi:hypothetical protein